MFGILPWILNLDKPPAPPLVVLVDPRAVSLVESVDPDPFAVDPRAVSLVESAEPSDPFAVDPRAVSLVE